MTTTKERKDKTPYAKVETVRRYNYPQDKLAIILLSVEKQRCMAFRFAVRK